MRSPLAFAPLCALALSLLALSLHAPSRAAAQNDDARQTAMARALFEEGVEHFDAGRLEQAEDRFRRSLAIRRSASVMFNLAEVLTQRGMVVESRELFLETSRFGAAPEELRNDAAARARMLAPRIARLTIHIEGAPEGSTVRLGEVSLAPETLGVAIPVDPGTRTVVVEHEGRVLARRQVRLADGARDSVTITVVTDADLPEGGGNAGDTGGDPLGTGGGSLGTGEGGAPGERTSDGGGVGEQWWFWTIIGVLAAGLVAGGIALGVVLEEDRYYCGTVDPCQITVELP